MPQPAFYGLPLDRFHGALLDHRAHILSPNEFHPSEHQPDSSARFAVSTAFPSNHHSSIPSPVLGLNRAHASLRVFGSECQRSLTTGPKPVLEGSRAELLSLANDSAAADSGKAGSSTYASFVAVPCETSGAVRWRALTPPGPQAFFEYRYCLACTIHASENV